MRLSVESEEENGGKDRWCSCEHSIQVNNQWAEEGFWPEWHFKRERIGDFE